MTVFFKLLLYSCFLAVSYARTKHEIKAWFLSLGLECTKDYPVTGEEILMLQHHKIPDSKQVKCLLACVYKKANWMDSKGTFVLNTANALAEEDYAADATKLENAKKLFEVCKAVNDQSVSDGEKGCDRATLLTKCLTEHAPKNNNKDATSYLCDHIGKSLFKNYYASSGLTPVAISSEAIWDSR